MPLVYEKAGEAIHQSLVDIMLEHHRELAACEVTVDVLKVAKVDSDGIADGHALRHNGYAAAATIKIVAPKQRALGQADALVTIDSTTWDVLDEAERVALLDHELEHLQVRSGAIGYPVAIDADTGELVGKAVLDEQGRPKLLMKLHDWQLGGFKAIAERHGTGALEVQEALDCRNPETGQYHWEWGMAEHPGQAKLFVKAAEPV